MNNYVTGSAIRELREKRKKTQAELAAEIGVGDKAVSKWENMRGLPDITLIEPLAAALGVSVIELFAGEYVTNRNAAGNMLRTKLYVCPVCGNIIHATGEAVVSCCGITLPVLEAEEAAGGHEISVEVIEDEYFVTLDHEMTKTHYVSFLAYAAAGKFEMVRLYPEGMAQARFFMRGHGMIYAYCNRHGLFKKKI